MKLVYSDALGWHVDLPTYGIVADSFRPVTAGKIAAGGVLLRDAQGRVNSVASVLALNPTVEVDVLADDCDGAGKICPEKISERYPERWGKGKRGAPNV